MITTTLFPGRYVQGADALERLGDELARLGDRHLLVASPSPLERLVPGLLPGLARAGAVRAERFGGECTDAEIDRLAALARDFGAQSVCALGGGKTLDAAKAAAARLGLRAAAVPTIASTDAPCSSVCVVYSEAGEFRRADVLPRNPDLVLVDTAVIARAPARFLASGMGDALATWFEADSCRAGRGRNIPGGTGSMTAHALSRLCYETVRDWGPQALTACEAGVVTPALERVVEANTLLSGLGFESGGLGAAHSIHNGLTALPAARARHHGEKVAFGVLASLFLTDKPAALMEEVYALCAALGLPTTFEALGLPGVTREELERVARKACEPGESIHNEPVEISPGAVLNALLAADALGRARKA
ncbi:Glycerol dehydrogenase [Fundidesulfovibrio magnetotacticus]|uniref:Glycerol dehydrogenase n=1 Tax=Fundidesulfovibrio magnetotacticus TaxID=2730080 RepID=A0A6V8LYS6_9BACT|nr:glycerol dehydrogenase [Fundidesulfovibrio magnetotacticus]GFK95388.1 Glycerol dehydrogenase [Fundidesulfovibrio magnetotacticus]